MKMTIDTSGFNAAARALSSVSGVPLLPVLEAEAAKVLEKAASLTPSAAVAKIRAAHELGGGCGGSQLLLGTAPAMTVTSVVSPAESVNSTRGI